MCKSRCSTRRRPSWARLTKSEGAARDAVVTERMRHAALETERPACAPHLPPSPAPPRVRASRRRMQNYAIENFGKQGVEVRTGVRVTEVRTFGAPRALVPDSPLLACSPVLCDSCCLQQLTCPLLCSSAPQVTKDTIKLKNGEELKYGVCVWSAGNAPRPIVQQLAAQIPEQVGRLRWQLSCPSPVQRWWAGCTPQAPVLC